MKEKYILLIFVAAILLVLVSIGALDVMGNSTDENNTTDVNLTINDTNDTNNTATQTQTKTSNSKASQKDSDNGVYYDEELNLYFDKNDKTVYDGQVPKGTSKSDLKQMANDAEGGNLD